VFLGLALTLGCALLTNAGFLVRHRGAVAAPPVDGRHPLRSSVTGGSAADTGRSSLAALIALEAGVFAASSLLVAGSIKLTGLHRNEGLVLGAAAGCLYGVSDISLKFLTHAAGGGLTSAFISPWALSALAASVPTRARATRAEPVSARPSPARAIA
jgi:hypothetical protein